MLDYSAVFQKQISPEFNRLLHEAFGQTCLELRGSFIITPDNEVPIVKRVPRFAQSDSYAASFTYQWKRFSTTQVDSEQGANLTHRDLVGKLQIKPEFFKNKFVLDIGVGVGRHAEHFCNAGAYFVGVDLSESVVQAEANLRRFNNGVVCQANLFELPFREGVFDFVYSIGVLHHTPSWKDALRQISCLPKPNSGLLSVWLYGLAFARRDEWIEYTKRFDKDIFLSLCQFLAASHRYARDEKKIISPLMALISRHMPFSVHHPNLERSVLALFDGYSPDFHAVTTSALLSDEMRSFGYSVRPGATEASCIGQRRG